MSDMGMDGSHSSFNATSQTISAINASGISAKDEVIYNGNFSKRDSIRNTIKVTNGNVCLVRCVVGARTHDNVYTVNRVSVCNGNAKIKDGTLIYGSAFVGNGNIEINNDSCIYGSVINNNGSVTLCNANVLGDITALNGVVNIENATVKGTVTLNAKTFAVGKNTALEHLHMNRQHTNEGVSVSFNQITLTGVSNISVNVKRGGFVFRHGDMSTRYVSSSHSARRRPRDNVEDSTQTLTLAPGSSLGKLSFAGEKCILTLLGDARYLGCRDIKGLVVKNSV